MYSYSGHLKTNIDLQILAFLPLQKHNYENVLMECFNASGFLDN